MFDNTMSVEQWKEQKQAERNDAFKAQQSCMEEALSSGKALTAYLLGRGRLGSHITSGNAAVVLKQVPQARAVLSFEDWSRYGRRVNKGAVGIPQLVRRNGYYAVEKQFDVSQTYGNKPCLSSWCCGSRDRLTDGDSVCQRIRGPQQHPHFSNRSGNEP